MPVIECNNCGSSFDVPPSKSDKKFCSRDCWSSDSRICKECESCDADFWTYRSVDKKFCSEDCYRVYENKEFVDVECQFCGEVFEKYEVQAEMYPKHYCDKSCKALDQPRTGNDFNYDLYGKNWNNNRDKVLDRDDYCCRICGDEDVQVHHIKGRKHFFDEELGTVRAEANEMENLITLCIPHHNQLEGRFSSSNPDEFVEKSKDLIG